MRALIWGVNLSDLCPFLFFKYCFKIPVPMNCVFLEPPHEPILLKTEVILVVY